MTNIVSPAHGGRRRRQQQKEQSLVGCEGCYGGMGVLKGYTCTYDHHRDQLYSLHYCNRCSSASSSSCTSSRSNNINRTSSSSSSHKYRRGTAWDYCAAPLGISSELAAAEGAADMDPDHHQDESAATNYTSSYNNEHEAGSTSKYEEDLATVLQETTTRTNEQIHIGTPTTEEDQGWLQLGIGRSSSPSGPRHRHRHHHHHHHHHGAGAATSTASSSSGTPAAAELDLFYGCSSGHGRSRAVVEEGMMMTEAAGSSPAFRHLLATEFQAPPHLLPTPTLGFNTTPPNTFFFQQQQQQINLGFRPLPPPPPPTSSSSSMPTRPYLISRSSSICQQIPASVGGDAAGPSASLLNLRVVDVPRRPHSGIWCILQASPNQDKEPFLPQISKSYLRIKDGRMPVLLLMKYLVKKLGLEAESEVEIRCRGQQLQPLMTIQDVRDTVWRPPTAADTLLITSFTFNIPPDSDPAHYVMLLHYHRSHRHI